VYQNNTYVGVGGSGNLWTSTDALTWTQRTSGTTSTIWGIASSSITNYRAIGNTGVLLTSSDTINWTVISAAKFSNTNTNINALIYGNGNYIYAGDAGMIATSTDGVTWTQRTSGTTSIISALSYNNSVFSYYGAGGAYGTSTDGVTWVSRSSGTTSQIFADVYNGTNLTVYGGVGGIVGRSSTLTTNVYSPYYNFSTHFYLPAIPFNNLNLAYVRAIP
jgi:hypothetical protein